MQFPALVTTLKRIGRAPRWMRIAGIVIVVLLLLRLALPWALVWAINHVLARPGTYHGRIEDVSLSLCRGTYRVSGLNLQAVPDGQPPHTLLTLDTLGIAISWSDVLAGRIRASVDLQHPVLTLTDSELSANLSTPREKPSSDQQWQARVGGMIPFRIDELAINEGSLRYQDKRRGIDEEITHLRLRVLGIAGGESASAQPANAVLTAALPGEGVLRIQGTISPWEREPTFLVRAAVSGIRLQELNPAAQHLNGLSFHAGVFSAYTELRAQKGSLEGYVKPIFAHLNVANYGTDADGGAKKAFIKAFIKLGEKLLENDETGELAAEIPIRGRLKNPSTNTWAVIGSALGNAFSTAILPGFDGIGSVLETSSHAP